MRTHRKFFTPDGDPEDVVDSFSHRQLQDDVGVDYLSEGTRVAIFQKAIYLQNHAAAVDDIALCDSLPSDVVVDI